MHLGQGNHAPAIIFSEDKNQHYISVVEVKVKLSEFSVYVESNIEATLERELKRTDSY